MTVYLDTSSLLKLYLDEPGSAAIEELIAGSEIACSRVTYAEARAGLARATRQGRVAVANFELLRESFERQWANIHPLEVGEALVKLAGSLAEKHALRGFDAIHLASALTLQRGLGETVTFSAADGRLMSAAAAEGLAV